VIELEYNWTSQLYYICIYLYWITQLDVNRPCLESVLMNPKVARRGSYRGKNLTDMLELEVDCPRTSRTVDLTVQGILEQWT
jgi:hypothetical protein